MLADAGFKRSLRLFDSIMVVVGVMIGSGIFIVSAEVSREYFIQPFRVSNQYALSLSTAQLLPILLIAALTWMNARGIEYGPPVQNVFTVVKTGAVTTLIVLGVNYGESRIYGQPAESFRKQHS